jgi:hypothetical protein
MTHPTLSFFRIITKREENVREKGERNKENIGRL